MFIIFINSLLTLIIIINITVDVIPFISVYCYLSPPIRKTSVNLYLTEPEDCEE